jgi:tetratricopeptide (TPR) repeat protein
MLFIAVLIAGKLGDKFYLKGVSAAKQRDYVTAIYWFEKAIPLKPRDPKFYIASANANTEIAKYYINSKLTARNEDEDEQAFIASEDYYANARSDYNMAIKLNPKRADSYFARAVCMLGINPEDAIADFSKAIKLDPGNYEAYFNRGLIYSKRGYLDKALADFNKAIKLKPEYAEAYANRGEAFHCKYENYKSEADYQKAMADFKTAIKLKPSYDKVYYYRSLAYKQKKDYGRAINDANKSVSLNPNDSEAYYNLASIYFESGDHKEAIAVITKLIKTQPRNDHAYDCRARYYNLMGMKDAARLDRVEMKKLLSN